jgi:hypothetical protein
LKPEVETVTEELFAGCLFAAKSSNEVSCRTSDNDTATVIHLEEVKDLVKA